MTSLHTEYKPPRNGSRRGASVELRRYVACEREICPIVMMISCQVTPERSADLAVEIRMACGGIGEREAALMADEQREYLAA